MKKRKTPAVYFYRPVLNPEVLKVWRSAYRSAQLAAGPITRRFTEFFAKLLGISADRVVPVANGTAALQAALAPIRLRQGDEVLTTPFTFAATAGAVVLSGATPRFADIDPLTYGLSPSAVKKELDRFGRKVKAVLVVHLYGHPALLEELGDLCRKKGLPLIEDCAQAHGAALRGRPVGTFGFSAAFSFYATKNIACGEGGMAVFSSRKDAEIARAFADHGRGKTGFERLGGNFRMNDLCAAVGLCQLKTFERFQKMRRRQAQAYQAALSGRNNMVVPVEAPQCRHGWHLYTILTPNRDGLRGELQKRGVETRVFYPRLLPEEPFYRSVSRWGGDFPVGERVSRTCLSLPLGPHLSERHLAYVLRILNQVWKSDGLPALR